MNPADISTSGISNLSFNMDMTDSTVGNYGPPLTQHEIRVESLLNEIVKLLIEIKNK